MNPEDPSVGLLRTMISQFLNSGQQQPDMNIGQRPPQQMQGYLGPTGRMFPAQGGMATEISGAGEHPTMPRKFTFSPMLVPGQVGANSLLQGQRPTWIQHAFAQDWARQNAQQLPQFNSLQEALAAEQWRHLLLDLATRGRMGIPGQYGLNPNFQLSPTYQ